MILSQQNSVLVIASESELPTGKRIWGTGGWLPPEEREALDWVTFLRLMGWGVSLTSATAKLKTNDLENKKWVIVACDPSQIREDSVALLESKLKAEPFLVVARACSRGDSFTRLSGAPRKTGENTTGRDLRWNAAQPHRWFSQKELEAVPMDSAKDVSILATLDGEPLIVGRRFGRGTVATLAFHPSEARDRDGTMTTLLRHLLIFGSVVPTAWLDWEQTVVLRMDDPGGAQNVHSKSWYYPKLREADWNKIIEDLRKRDARLSIGYIGGWVDDGDVSRGKLTVAGKTPHRAPGQVYPSPLVKYVDFAGHSPRTLHNYISEFRGIQKLRTDGLGDVELHGYTHIHPNRDLWVKSDDKYEAVKWFRELGKFAESAIASKSFEEHPLQLGIKTLKQYFDVYPTTLICPGDEWTNEVLEQALDFGIYLVSSYYLALRDGEKFCWAQHICAPYLDEPDAKWFKAGLPVVGYFHDREPALEGIGWISKYLDRWQEAGAKRFIDFRELTAAIKCRLQIKRENSLSSLSVINDANIQLVKPLAVNIYFPDEQIPAKISVMLDDTELNLPIESKNNHTGLLYLPVL